MQIKLPSGSGIIAKGSRAADFKAQHAFVKGPCPRHDSDGVTTEGDFGDL